MRLSSTLATLTALALPAMTLAKPIERFDNFVRDTIDSYVCQDDQTLVRTWSVGNTVSSAVFPMPSGTSCKDTYGFAVSGAPGFNQALVATPSDATSAASMTTRGGQTGAASLTPPAAANSDATSTSPAAGADATSTTVGTPAAAGTPVPTHIGTTSNTTAASTGGKRHVAYWDAFDFPHNGSLIGADSGYFDTVTHLIMAFLDNSKMPNFNGYVQTNYDNVAGEFLEDLKARRAASGGNLQVMMSIGGWGFEKPFQTADPDATAAGLVELTKANPWIDGYDIDWEYPTIAETAKIQQYVLSLRKQLDEAFGAGKKLISVSLPGAEIDIRRVAYGDKAMMTTIDKNVDFFNLMTYDILNRANNVTNYHASLPQSQTTVSIYEDLGIDTEKMNVGFAMYAKVFNLAGPCEAPYLNCRMPKLQTDTPDCLTCGVDLKQSIALRYNTINNYFPDGYADKDKWQSELTKIIADSGDENSALKSYVPDAETNVWVTDGSFWTWQSPYAMGKACSGILPSVGGIMSWAIGQDVSGLDHFKALQTCVAA